MPAQINILVVDDIDEHLREIADVTRKTIERTGLDIGTWLEADDKDNALSKVAEETIGIAVIDLCLDQTNAQDASGLEIARELARDQPNCQLVLVTAHIKDALDRQNELKVFRENVVEKKGNYLESELPRAIRRAAQYFVDVHNLRRFCTLINRSPKKMWAMGRCPKKPGLQWYECPMPGLPNESVLVQTASLGICGTDIQAFGANEPYDKHYEIVDFHEAIGRIIWKGEKVRELDEDDVVIPVVRRCQTWDPPEPGSSDASPSFDFQSCEQDWECENYRRPDVCSKGEYSKPDAGGPRIGYRSRGTGRCHGFGSEFFLDTPKWLVRVGPASDFKKEFGRKLLERLILVEPLAVVWKMKREIENARPIRAFHDRMLTLGLGPIGYLATLVMGSMYPGLQCTVIDRMPDIEPWIQGIKNSTQAQLRYFQLAAGEEWCHDLDDERFDLIVEATGNPQAVLGEAIKVLAPGGILVILSVAGSQNAEVLKLNADSINRIVKGNVKIIGSVNEAREDYENAVRFLKAFHAQLNSPLDELTHRLPASPDVISKVSKIQKRNWPGRREPPKIVLDAPDLLSDTGDTVLDTITL